MDTSRYDIQKDRAFLLLARIDGPLLKKQRAAVEQMIANSAPADGPSLIPELHGIQHLLDAIADFCHDELGMDTIIEDTDNLDYRGDDDETAL